MRTVQQRLDDGSIVEANTGCRLWIKCGKSTGYGFIVVNGKNRYAHRVSYELAFGPIAKGLFVCHKCDTPSCIEPSHLFIGTAKENSDDSVKKFRNPFGEKNGNSHLTEQQVISIRADDRHPAILSRSYSVSRRTIELIKRGKSWDHLTTPICLKIWPRGLKAQRLKQVAANVGSALVDSLP